MAAPSPQINLTVSPGSSLRRVYLRRLERLQRLRGKHARELNPRGLRLLDHALFAAYCACRDIGVEAEARSTLRGGPPKDVAFPSDEAPRLDC